MRKYLSLAVLLSLVEIAISVYLTFWREHFWNAIEQRDLTVFTTQIVIFTAVALTFCLVSSTSSYFVTRAALLWRFSLNTIALKLKHRKLENVAQRIQEDCMTYPASALTLIFGLGKAVTQIIVFCVVLTLVFHAYYIAIILIYAVISTYIARKLALPLVHTNYEKQKREATYRDSLVYSDFGMCQCISIVLAKQTKRLAYFQNFYSQLGVVIPLFIIAPSFFAGVVSFGAMMQAQSIMSSILDNMSYGIYTFNEYNKFKSCKQRLRELGVI